MFGGGAKGPGNNALWQFRSQSLPRLESTTAAEDFGAPPAGPNNPAGAAISTLKQQQLQQQAGSSIYGASGSNGAAAAAAAAGQQSSLLLSNSTKDGGRGFTRAAKTVGDCLSQVKVLSESVNSAASFRENCSQVLGAAFAASLALQELLSNCNSRERDLLVQQYAVDLQSKLLSAETLVLKYGHEGWWHRLTRFEGKAAVAAKFTAVQEDLHDISSSIWDLIDPQNRVKRNVHTPEVGKMLTTGNAFSRHTLRQGGGGSQVSALVAFPDDDNSSNGQGQDGVVVWAADSTLKLQLPSSQCDFDIKPLGSGTGLSCLLHDPRGLLWAGYTSGCVAVYSVDKTSVVAEKLAVADATITALAVDPQTGHCWAGTEEGVVVIVSLTLHSSSSSTGKLDHVETLMAPGAGLPYAASSVDNNDSSASSSPTAASTIAASTAPTTFSSNNRGGRRGGHRDRGGGGGGSGAYSTVSSRRHGGGGGGGGGSSAASVYSSSTSSRSKRESRRTAKRNKQQQYSVAEHEPPLDPIDTLSDWLGGTMQQAGLGGTRSQRLKEVTIHAGRVNAIVIHAGRAYTAGGTNNSTLLVWCTETYALLRVISKRSTAWCRSPITCMTLVHWASTRRAGSASSTGGPLASGGSMIAAVGSGGVAAVGGGGSLSSQYSSAALASQDGSVGHGSGVNLAPVVNINSGGGGVGAGAGAGGTRSGSASLPDMHLVTGHVNGNVVVWDPSGDDVQPVLLVGPDSVTGKKCVKSIVLLEELGVLASGHSNGRVYMRKLDPKVPLHARDDGGVGRWSPTTFSLQAHRLGLSHMVGHGHMIITSGKTGSIKLWPETTIRCLASEANVQLPYSRNPISEAVNSLLHRAGMMSSTQSMSSQPPAYAGSSMTAATAAQRGANTSAFAAAAAAATGATTAAGPAAATASPQRQQQQQDGGEDGSGSGYWSNSDRLRAANLVIDWSALNIDINNRRTWLGEGSFGRVTRGCYNQTDVAVKVLTDAGSGSSVRASGGNQQQQQHHSEATWDKVRLETLLHEVGILSTLRHPNVVLFMGVCLSPPAVVTEYCPLRSLYDVLKKANSDPALAARLTWQRRLRMALDAAKGLVHLHNHKPTILHRDLKSPNLFVMTNYAVKVGDFNLSRYMAVDKAYVQSTLELNPRWSAPEVIKSGFYSTAGDVFSFGVVLWEMLSWQEPWAEEELSCYAIMTAVQQEGQRPQLPPLDQLPGQVGPPAAVEAYKTLMEDCWAQNPVDRPTFDQIVDRLKAILLIEGPVQYPGTKAAAAGSRATAAGAVPVLSPPPPSPQRGVSESAAMAAAAAAIVAQQGAGDNGGPAAGAAGVGGGGQATPAAAAAAAAAGVGPGGCHLRSRSDVVGGAAAAAGGAGSGSGGPETADLLQLGHVEDDLPGPSAPRPPPAALPPIPGTSDELLGPGGGSMVRGGSSVSGDGSGSFVVSGGGAAAAADGSGGGGGGCGGGVLARGGGVAAAAAALPPRPPHARSPFASQAAQEELEQQQQAAGGASGGVSPLRGSEEGGGGSGATPRSSTGGGGRSPSTAIRPSPFASTFAAAALLEEGCSSSKQGGSAGGDDSSDVGVVGGSGQQQQQQQQGSGAAGLGSGNVTSPVAAGLMALPVVNEHNVGARLDAAVDAASAVAADDPVRKARTSRGSSSGGGAAAAAAAAANGGAAAAGDSTPTQEQQPPPAAGISSTGVQSIFGWLSGKGSNGASSTGGGAGGGQPGSSSAGGGGGAGGVPDLISLDSESRQ